MSDSQISLFCSSTSGHAYRVGDIFNIISEVFRAFIIVLFMIFVSFRSLTFSEYAPISIVLLLAPVSIFIYIINRINTVIYSNFKLSKII